VNKVNTKATLRCPADAPWIPEWAVPHIQSTVRIPVLGTRRLDRICCFQPQYTANSHSILITSTVHRSQSQNVDDCLSKVSPIPMLPPPQLADTYQLRDLVVYAAEKPLVSETSEEQKERVRGLQRAENARRKTAKTKHSAKKSSRSARGWD
jgi:peptidyl-tRNA hydrolase ICT1